MSVKAVFERRMPCELPPVPSMSMQFPDAGATQRLPKRPPPTISTLVPPMVEKAPAEVADNIGVSSLKFSSRSVAAEAQTGIAMSAKTAERYLGYATGRPSLKRCSPDGEAEASL